MQKKSRLSVTCVFVRRLCRVAALALLFFPIASLATTVRLQTSFGEVDIELFDASAPLTVANFLTYVNSGAYDNIFIHRSMPGFVIQSGGYAWDASSGVKQVAAGAPVNNEFSSTRSNLRGTIAMAKVGGDPHSATTEWFINLADNSANLDNQNGGFTVFGQVTGNGMDIIDAIAALTTVNAGGAFGNLPLTSVPASGVVQKEHLVIVSSVAVLPVTPASSESDRLFNYLEAVYPQYLLPANATSASAAGYYYRYYPATNAYVGTANGLVYYLGPLFNGEITALGTLADWIAMAAGAGY